MLVRSASTPVLGALLPPGSQSPAVTSPAVHFAESPAAAYHPPAISCHLAGPGSDHERSRGLGAGMRRTSSEGNLASLAGRADDHHHLLPPSGKCAPRARPVPLETIQSFTDRRASTDDEEEDGDDGFEADREMSFGHFSFAGGSTYSQEHPLFLARGLGIDRLGSGLLGADGGGGGFGGSNLVTSGNGGDRSGIEMHYKKMIEEDPCNGIFLRNYAQFLYRVSSSLICSTANLGTLSDLAEKQSNKQSHLFRHHFQVKGDYRRAEEYYSRAILADPDDGELLSEYINFSLSFVCSVHKFHVNGLA